MKANRQFRLGERIRWAFTKAIAMTTVGALVAVYHLTTSMPRFF